MIVVVLLFKTRAIKATTNAVIPKYPKYKNAPIKSFTLQVNVPA